MNTFDHLSAQDKKALLKFPAYISLLAANSRGFIDETEKNTAIRFAHIKTFACDSLLNNFYLEADKVFQHNIEQLDNDLPKGKDSRDAAIKKELLNLEKIVLKLGKEYSETMHHCMKSFTEHVSKAHHNVLIDFILPISLPGMTK